MTREESKVIQQLKGPQVEIVHSNEGTALILENLRRLAR